MARRLGMEGVAVVRVTVGRDGQLAAPPQIVSSAGHHLLDDEVIEMVRRAAPFAVLPPGVDGKTSTFEVAIRFALTH